MTVTADEAAHLREHFDALATDELDEALAVSPTVEDALWHIATALNDRLVDLEAEQR